ncbi:MAG: sugar-binding protein [Granulosicoccus sp.]
MYWLPDSARSTIVKSTFLSALASAFLLSLSACDDTTRTSPGNTDQGGISLPMPAGFIGLRAVIQSNVYAILSINGNEPQRFGPGDELAATFKVTRGATITGNLRWFESLPGVTELLLATYPIEETITDSVNISIDRLAYITEGTGLDLDNDGFSNLRERLADSDPLNASETPNNTPDVRISRITAAQRPIIDGFYDDGYRDGATFNDVNGEELDIDNLMIDLGARRADGDTEFRWFAMHDGTFLYIYVLGESNALATPVRDSTEFFQDDSIDIFIDGNNSKGSFYDGVDDRHIIIPLLTSPTDTTGPNTTAITTGPNSASLPSVTFSTCLCDGQHTWEVRLPLEAFDISVDRLFGIEVQLNLDNNGGTRDAKWGWSHPSRVNEDVDNTFVIPSFMGTAVLN